jgi:AbrB family looped-hinge helix DNA binding protein
VAIVRIGPKGQVVLPKEVRDRLGIAPGDRVVVDVEDGEVILIPVRVRTVSDLVGILRTHRAVDPREARRDYQAHLVQKFREGQADA